MTKELEREIIKKLRRRGVTHKLVFHEEETISVRAKAASLRRQGLEDTGIIKSVVFRYQGSGEIRVEESESALHYIVACTSGPRRINLGELRVELGLSAAETASLTLDGIALEQVTGKRRGEIGPLIPTQHVEVIYFTNDLMREAQADPERLYDIPLSLKKSLLVPAAALWKVLQERSSKYRVASEFAGEINFEIMEARIENRRDGPYFGGSMVSFRGRDYEIKHPGRSSCVAFPIPDEYDDRGRRRVILPIGYELLKNRLS